MNRKIRKIIFNTLFIVSGITFSKSICNFLGDYTLVLFPVLFVVTYFLAIFILADYRNNTTLWNRLLLEKYSIKLNKFVILNLFNFYHLLGTILLNLRKKLKLHRGLR